MKSLAIKPTRIAATIVPSRTPSRCLNIINDKIAAITVIDESNAILVLPKSVLNTSETALTVASPGNIATFATISINTPKPRMPVRPTKEEIDVYKLEAPLEMEYEPRKIKLSREWEEKEPVKVQRSWIDSNDHVNNSWYVKTAFEQLPQDLEIRQLRVEYKKQAYEGDILYPRYAREEQRTLVALCDEKQKPYAVIECR